MTEDDTFRVLKRVPFSEMSRIMIEYLDDHTAFGSVGALEKLFGDHGWEPDEFLNIWNKNGSTNSDGS